MASNFGFKATEKDSYYFVSYNMGDALRVAPICKILHEKGLPIWYDEGIPFHTYWESVLAEKIDKCEAAIFFITKGIFEKGRRWGLDEIYIYKEYDLAKRYKKKRLVVFLDEIADDEVPYSLMSWWQEIDPKVRQGILSYNERSTTAANKIFYELGYRNTSESQNELNNDSLDPVSKEAISSLKRITDTKSKILTRDSDESKTIEIINNKYSHFTNIQYCNDSFGRVFSAFDTISNMDVAIKLYSSEGLKIPFFSNSDLYIALRNLSNKNICKIIDQDSELICIVMQYIQGDTLEKCLKSSWRWFNKPDIILNTSIGILNGLKGLHDNNVYYGDLTPRNIIIDDKNNAWLCDFSESNFNGSCYVDKTRFIEKYCSPDKAPNKAMDYRSDIYEFGIILSDLIFLISHDESTREVLLKVVAKCTKRNPDDRYQSVDEILAILKPIKKGDK